MTLTVDQIRDIKNSKEFEEFILRYANIPRFRDISLDAKLHYYIENIYNKSTTFTPPSSLKNLIYEREVVSIDEFLSNPHYAFSVGKKILSKWRRELLEFFDPKNSYNEFIMTGAIRTGKSYISRIGQIYNLYKILCLRDPQGTFNLSPESSLWGMFISTTQKKAYNIGLLPFIRMLRQCPIFKEVYSVSQLELYSGDKIPFFAGSGWRVQFQKNVEFNVGSELEDIVGNNVFSFSYDEAEIAGSVGKVLEVYQELKTRVKTTFPLRNFTFMSIISSSGLQNGVVGSYLQKLEPDDMPYLRICKYSRWELDETKDPYVNGSFWVLRGNQNYPSEILTDEVAQNLLAHPEKQYPNTKIIRVPEMYRQDFRLNLRKALCDIAGEPTVTDDLPFPDVTCIEDLDLPFLQTVYCSTNDTTSRLFTQLSSDLFIQDFEGRYVFKRAPNAVRYGHCDLSVRSSSETAIVILHKEINYLNEEVIIVDLIINVLTRDRLRFESVEDLIVDLKRHGLNFYKFSFDQWNSEGMIQSLTEKKIAKHVEKKSLLDANPVRRLSALIAEDRFKCGKAEKLKKQLSNVSIDSDKNKVRKNGEQAVKDLYEAVTMATDAALSNTRDKPTSFYNGVKRLAPTLTTLNSLAELNLESGDEIDRDLLIAQNLKKMGYTFLKD